MVITRTFRLGTHDRRGVFIDARISGYGELSITGFTRHHKGAGYNSGGQIVGIAKEAYALRVHQRVRSRLIEVWGKWHLNHMRAGCYHQRALGWTNYNDHPSEPCPVCSYKFGTQWFKEELPESVIQFIESLPNEEL